MRTILLRLSAFLLVTFFSAVITAQDGGGVESRDFNISGGGSGSCVLCDVYQSGPVAVMSCKSPDPGGWGRQNCRVESYPEGTYCFTDGNQCCVD
jgi:hypothetical protein